ncbi:sugar phosphate isomerase/epimerase family protein [Rhodopirellula sp. MGV]|uniref:sugar phosphate isomerase/epimerase family protein n=1 Tax=Rhodopirellula sp. MGV TaxID=2023130 RepID=UPI000B969E9A|nr:sugar phosphate isomerase/epimerase family protein [Rhodopirellula sp. MGV]OYP32252.1 AP endonuclease [Rhodopirellula sp. MGV]PNY35965.1 sugar phosphate isomerase/epimerase [Rhodopirellula baltica]
MELGFVSAILPDASLEDVFENASGLGFDCVEVMCWPPGKAARRYAGITHVDVLSLDENAIDQINVFQEDYGVKISALGYYPNALAPDAEEAQLASEHIKAVIEASAKLGINTMNSFIGRDWTKSVDDNWPKFLETWKPIIECAEQNGVRVGIENCPMFFTNDEWPGGKNLAVSPDIWSRMFEDIPSDHFGLNFDPSHLVLQHMDYIKPLRDFAGKLFHVHAKDLRIDQHKLDQVGVFANPNRWHSPKLPGLGDIDWGKFFGTLVETGYNGPVCVEVEDRAYEGSQDDALRALQQSHNFLRSYVV